MNLKQQEITKFNNDIKKAKRRIKKLTPEYEKYSTLFHSKAEVEGLYQSLSQFAGENGLVISKIQKGKPVAVSKAAALASGKKKKKTKKQQEYFYSF